MIIDTHVHMYPTLEDSLKRLGVNADLKSLPLEKLKSIGLGPRQKWNTLMQSAASNMRHLPKRALPVAEKLHALSSIYSVAVCSTKDDLIKSMEDNGIDKALVIAHPPLIPNDFVLKECATEDRLYPVVNIPISESDPSSRLKEYVARGAVALKIHAAADGLESNNTHYEILLETANELGLPTIIHTGCIHIKPFYKDPDMGHAQKFEQWFEKYKKINFILAHMNYHYPKDAIEYCEKYANVYCDSSWQPTEVIQEAMERIPNKLMFGTDWPLVGSNQTTMVQRLKKLNIDKELREQFTHITAKKIFKLESKDI